MSLIDQLLLDIVVQAFPEASGTQLSLDIPPRSELGDFALGVFSLAKITHLTPPAIAERLASAIRNRVEYFHDVTILGGYVNFFLTPGAWTELLSDLSTEDRAARNETIVVDYIGANTGKPLHIGHICTPSIGQTIINTHKHLWYHVISDSHFGDWGGIFGKLITQAKLLDYIQTIYPTGRDNLIELSEDEKCIYSSIFSKIEDWQNQLIWEEREKILMTSDLLTQEYLKDNQWDPLKKLYYSYILVSSFSEHNELIELQCRKEFKKLSSWDEINVALWQDFTKSSIEATQKQLDLLNIHTKYNIGESFYEWLNLPRPNNEDYPDLKWNMKDIVKELIEKKIATPNEDGSVGVVFAEESKIPSCVLQKKDGTGLYLTSDLAAIKYRLDNWKPSKIIYCIDVRQQLHLRQAFNIAHRAWDQDGLDHTELFHAYNGFIKLKEGAMSTRKGTVIFLKDLIDEGYKRTDEILKSKGANLSQEDIKAVTIAAIKYSYLSVDREKDVVFDWDKALNFEGNSGPYIQYAYVRAKNIIEKSPLTPLTKGGNGRSEWGDSLLLSVYDTSCLRKLTFFEKSVVDTAAKYKPHILATYCYELASEFSSWYAHTPKVLEEPDMELRNFRLTLVAQVRDTLKKGFELLAIEMPGKM